MAISDLISQQKSLVQDLNTNKTLLEQAKEDGDQEAVDFYKSEISNIQSEYNTINEQVTSFKESEVFTPSSTPVKPETYTGTDTADRVQQPEGGKYKVDAHSYPVDLLSNPAYGKNYAIFYINEAVDPKLEQDASLNTDFVDDFDQTTRRRGSVVATALTPGQLIGASSAVGAIKAGGLGLLGGSKAALKTAGGVGAANAVGYAAVAKEAATSTRAQKRLKTAIALHIPNQLLVRYGVVYGEEDTIDFAIAAETLKALSGENKLSNTTDVGIATAANIALRNGAQAGAVSAATGLAPNPKKEQVFKGVDFRTFSFEYQFFPRSPEEAKNVKNIVDAFKFHMHPEFKGPGEFLFIYPSEFDIVYYTNGKENKNIHKHTSCVLTEMSVNYTPNGVFNTFFEDNLIGGGMPTQINMILTFRELQILNKQLVKEGL